MRRCLALALLAALTSGPAAAARGRACAGVSFPSAITVSGTTLELNGLGLREATVFAVDVFVAALYVQQPSRDAAALLGRDEPVRVVLHFVRDTSADTIAEEMDEGYRANSPKVPVAQKKQLFGWLEDMAVGEAIAFTYEPGKGLEVRVAGKKQGVIADRAFASATLGVLIGPTVVDEDLRAGLLGGQCR